MIVCVSKPFSQQLRHWGTRTAGIFGVFFGNSEGLWSWRTECLSTWLRVDELYV